MFLWALQRVFTGEPGPSSVGFSDVRRHEMWAVAPLLALSLVIGVAPRPLLDVVEPAATTVVTLLGR